jgi:hypothetical protein
VTRALALGAAASIGAAALAGCGSSEVDQGGFTASDRDAAAKVLGFLARTSVYTAARNMTLTQGALPTDCVVHIQSRKPLTFRVFMSWKSTRPLAKVQAQARAYSWIDAVMGSAGVKSDYKLGSGNETSEAALLAQYRDVLQKPVERCLLLENQRFALLSSAGARRVG